MNFSKKLILALDFNQEKTVLDWVEQCLPYVSKFKVGKELFTACGPSIVEKIQKKGGEVFLDLKFHDIPNTVYQAVLQASKLNIFMLNVHVLGGRKMLEAAYQGIQKSQYHPILLGVTVLTSLNEKDLGELGFQKSQKELVLSYAELANQCGLDGVVASVQEGKNVKKKLGQNFVIVSPGIRWQDSVVKNDDQASKATVQEALDAKIDYLVLGRSIFQASDPIQQLTELIEKHTQ